MTPDLSNLLLAPILTFLLVLGGVTSLKLLSGRIVTRGLIAGSASGAGYALGKGLEKPESATPAAETPPPRER